MAYIKGTWVSPIDITGTMKINQTDEALQNIVSDDAGSIANFLDAEMTKVGNEINSYGPRLDDLETFQGTVQNIMEW